jgi:hypothetical protein
MTDAVINISTSAQVAFVAKTIETQCGKLKIISILNNIIVIYCILLD